LGYNSANAGLVVTGIAWILLAAEIVQPTLSRLGAGKSSNLVLEIPARSKEFQKVVIIAPAGEQELFPESNRFPSLIYWILQLFLGLDVVLFQVLKIWLTLPMLAFCSILPVVVMLIIAFLPRKVTSGTTETTLSASVLPELASLLMKARPATTSVMLLFTGSSSLNSGIVDLPKTLKKGPELTYVINLTESASDNFEILVTEGPLALPADPFLLDTFEEVAVQKGLTLKKIKSGTLSGVLPLKFQKIRTATIAVPCITETDSATIKNFRELLAGLIRQIEA
jgi:hypothetical protein